MAYKAVVFDLDGTLLNTLEDLRDAMNRVLEDKGFPTHSTDVFRYFVGNGAAMVVERALPPEKRDGALKKDCLAAFLKEYNKNWNIKTRPYKGIWEMLDGLEIKQIVMAVLTNKPQRFAERCIQEFFPHWQFKVVIGQREGFPLKPDPSGAKEISQRLDIPFNEFLYLGDSNTDMKTAVRAHMFPVGALWGFRPEKELRDAGAVEVISRPMELLKFVM